MNPSPTANMFPTQNTSLVARPAPIPERYMAADVIPAPVVAHLLKLECPCGVPHWVSRHPFPNAETYYKRFPRAYIELFWPFSGTSRWEDGGMVTSWTDATTGEHCQAMVRGDGKIFGTPKCSPPTYEPHPQCIAKAKVVDGHLQGYDGMYLW